MNAVVHIYLSFMGRYHQLIANYRKEKKLKSYLTEDTAWDSTFDTEELKEGKKIETEQVVFLVGFCLSFRKEHRFLK